MPVRKLLRRGAPASAFSVEVPVGGGVALDALLALGVAEGVPPGAHLRRRPRGVGVIWLARGLRVAPLPRSAPVERPIRQCAQPLLQSGIDLLRDAQRVGDALLELPVLQLLDDARVTLLPGSLSRRHRSGHGYGPILVLGDEWIQAAVLFDRVADLRGDLLGAARLRLDPADPVGRLLTGQHVLTGHLDQMVQVVLQGRSRAAHRIGRLALRTEAVEVPREFFDLGARSPPPVSPGIRGLVEIARPPVLQITPRNHCCSSSLSAHPPGRRPRGSGTPRSCRPQSSRTR